MSREVSIAAAEAGDPRMGRGWPGSGDTLVPGAAFREGCGGRRGQECPRSGGGWAETLSDEKLPDLSRSGAESCFSVYQLPGDCAFEG